MSKQNKSSNQDLQKKKNKSTEKSGLSFNVNTVRSKTKSYYESHRHVIKSKSKESGEETSSILMFSGGHFALTAALEAFCEYIFKQLLNHTEKDNTGLRNVGKKTLRYSILLDLSLEKYFSVELKYWNKDQTYQDQLPISKKDIDTVRNKVNKDLFLSDKSHNLFCFMLLKVYHDLIITAFNLVAYAGKKSLDAKSIKTAIEFKFTNNIVNELVSKIQTVMNLVNDKSYSDEEDNKEENKEDDKEDSQSDNEKKK